MYALIADMYKCINCGECTTKVPQFKKYRKMILISDAKMEEEEAVESVKVLIRGCPVGAISLDKHLDSNPQCLRKAGFW